MSKKKISFGVFFGGISLTASSLSGIIIYPLILNSCTKEIAGLWFFFTSFTIIISLGQAGLAPVVMRRAAEARIKDSNEYYNNFFSLLTRSYKIVTILVLSISIIIYFTYVHWVLKENSTIFSTGLFAWILFVGGNLINILYSRNFYIINGFGEVGWDKVIQTIVSLFTILGYFIALRLGLELIGLSSVFFLASILFAISSKLLLKKFTPKKYTRLPITSNKMQLIEIFKEGLQILVLNIVAILVMNKDNFLVERFIGLTTLPLFSALSRIQMIIMSVSLLIPQMIFPYISQSFSRKDYVKTNQLYWRGVIFSVIIGLLVSTITLASANLLIPLWLGDDNYLGNNILALLLVMALIVIHHNAHASAVISTGKTSFMWPAIINGILSIPFSIIGIKYYGIEGMIIGNIIATILPSIYVVSYSIQYFKRLRKS